MSAFRFVQQLQREGYLHESDASLTLVRREDLFRRWQGGALRRISEVPMRFLLRGRDSRAALKRMLDSGRACLAIEQAKQEQFSVVTDAIRTAARIPQDRVLRPDRLQAACAFGLEEVLG